MKRNNISILLSILLSSALSYADYEELDDTAYNENPVQAVAALPSAIFGGHPYDSAKKRQERADKKNHRMNQTENNASNNELDDTAYNENPVQAVASLPSAIFGGHPYDSAKKRQERADKKNKAIKKKQKNKKKDSNRVARDTK